MPLYSIKNIWLLIINTALILNVSTSFNRKNKIQNDLTMLFSNSTTTTPLRDLKITPRSSNNPYKCFNALINPSSNRHLSAHNLSPSTTTTASRVAFSSCIIPSEQSSGPYMWRHLRRRFKPDLWIWLGDNAYGDGNDMNFKRHKYNEVRNDKYYAKNGPMGEPKIPVTGIWDDHDFAGNDQGMEYPCVRESQREFSIHMNLPTTDVRHPEYDGPASEKQMGIYSSLKFAIPEPYNVAIDDDDDDKFNHHRWGIHVINLDLRMFRHHLYFKGVKNECFDMGGGGPKTDFLGAAQWSWLERELLTIPSEIKIISSSLQVLPTTNFKTRRLERYCAYDGPDGSFMDAIASLGEGPHLSSGDEKVAKEIWADVPQARRRLLRLAQRSINDGMAKVVVFLSGNVHWGDILAKPMAADVEEGGGEAQVLYEVTASGIGRMRTETYDNPYRVRLRTCDKRGDGLFVKECRFPFKWQGRLYHDCTTDTYEDDDFTRRDGRPWCYYRTTGGDNDVNYRPFKWGYCLPEELEVVKREDQYVSRRTCGDHYHQSCGIEDIYGGVSVDWEHGKVKLAVYTPAENVTDGVASSIDVTFTPEWKLKQEQKQELFHPEKQFPIEDDSSADDLESDVDNNNNNNSIDNVNEESKNSFEDNENAVGESKDDFESNENAVEENKNSFVANETVVEESKDDFDSNENAVEENKNSFVTNETAVEEKNDTSESNETAAEKKKYIFERNETLIEEKEKTPETNVSLIDANNGPLNEQVVEDDNEISEDENNPMPENTTVSDDSIIHTPNMTFEEPITTNKGTTDKNNIFDEDEQFSIAKNKTIIYDKNTTNYNSTTNQNTTLSPRNNNTIQGFNEIISNDVSSTFVSTTVFYGVILLSLLTSVVAVFLTIIYVRRKRKALSYRYDDIS